MQRRRDCYRDDEVAAVVVRCIGFVRNDTHDLVTVGISGARNQRYADHLKMQGQLSDPLQNLLSPNPAWLILFFTESEQADAAQFLGFSPRIISMRKK